MDLVSLSFLFQSKSFQKNYYCGMSKTIDHTLNLYFYTFIYNPNATLLKSILFEKRYLLRLSFLTYGELTSVIAEERDIKTNTSTKKRKTYIEYVYSCK